MAGRPEVKPETNLGAQHAGPACGDFGDFSTLHSNGTNKVIDTHGTSCYAPPCIPKLILAEVLPLHPQ